MAEAPENGGVAASSHTDDVAETGNTIVNVGSGDCCEKCYFSTNNFEQTAAYLQLVV